MALSTTDYTVLAIIWRDGPCTTYVVMRDLASSPSTFYRNRASSTYRVAQRLTDLGLVEQVDEDVGSRGERLIQVTPDGLEALRSWLSPPIPRVEIAHTIDLVRLRMFFLKALPPEERLRFVDDAIAFLRELEAANEERVEKPTDPFQEMGSLGTLLETRARIEWLERVRERLTELD